MMATQIDEILETVRTTHVITCDVEQTVALQDLFNVNAEQAAEIMGALDREGRRRLLWIVNTVSGYDAFEFWLTHGMLNPWADSRLMQMAASVHDAYESRARELDDREFELLSRQRDLDTREADLRYREGSAEIKAQRRAGEQVRVLRKQVERLQTELERERLLNRRAKKLVCWVERGL